MPGVDVFAAVADPTRRAILDMVAKQERSVSQLVEAFPRLCQPTVSHHLRLLREAGLVDVRRDHSRRLYTANPEGLDELRRWLDQHAPTSTKGGQP